MLAFYKYQVDNQFMTLAQVPEPYRSRLVALGEPYASMPTE